MSITIILETNAAPSVGLMRPTFSTFHQMQTIVHQENDCLKSALLLVNSW